MIDSCSCHLFETCTPVRCSASSHNSRISHVAMYRAPVFCLQVMYTSTSSNSTFCTTPPSKGGYYQLPLGHLCNFLPVIWRSTPWWNPSIVHPMQGVTTQVYETKRRTACTTSLKKLLDVCTFPPSFLRILKLLSQFFLAFQRLANTADQSFSMAVRRRTRYSNYNMLVSGQS